MSPTPTIPSPLPDPSPAPPTSQTLVTIPLDIWDKLQHQQQGLTQPAATVIAACIALAAAVIALIGIRIQVKANVREAQRSRRSEAARSQRDRQAAAELGRLNREAETQRGRRADRVQLVAQTIRQTLKLHQLASEMNQRSQMQAAEFEDLRADLNDVVAELVLAREMLLLNELRKSAQALRDYIRQAANAAESGEAAMADVRNSRVAMVATFTKEISIDRES